MAGVELGFSAFLALFAGFFGTLAVTILTLSAALRIGVTLALLGLVARGRVFPASVFVALPIGLTVLLRAANLCFFHRLLPLLQWQ